jgi:hypothetical protein
MKEAVERVSLLLQTVRSYVKHQEQSILVHDVDFSFIPDIRKEVPYLDDLDKKLWPNVALFEMKNSFLL